MRVLAICPHFEPDDAPTGVVMSRLAAELVELGHSMTVVTALPWYRRHGVEPGWGGRLWRTERTDWGRIVRLHPLPTDKRNIPARALAFGAFTFEAALASLRGPRPDAVLAMSPPLTLGTAGWFAARRWGAPMVFNVQDIFPDVAVEVGSIRNPRVIAIARRLERWTYRHADAVTVLSEDLAANVAAKLGPRRPELRVIPNFVDCDQIRPGPRLNDYRRELGLGDEIVVMYAGNLGFSQSVEIMIESARRRRDRRDVAFVVNGGGSALPDLEARAAGLPNVHFVGFQPAERLPEVLAAADLHVVPLRAGLGGSSVPSKLYSVLASARPVLASVDPGTEVPRTLEAAAAGVSVAPEDQDAFDTALAGLLADEVGRRRMGDAGRAFVESWMSPAAVAGAYVELFEELRNRH